MKLTDYESLQDIKNDDLLFIDGPRGPHHVTIKTISSSPLFNRGEGGGVDEVYIGDEEPTDEPRPDLWVDISGENVILKYLNPKTNNYKILNTGESLKSVIEVSSSFTKDIGKTIRIANEKSNWEKVFDGSLSVLFNVPSDDIYTVTLLGFDNHVEFSKTIHLSDEYNAVKIEYPKNTFGNVQSILNYHREKDVLKIGDEIQVMLTNGVEMVYQVGGIGIYDAHDVVFVPKWLYPDTQVMNSSGSAVGGYKASNLNSWNTGTLFNIFPNDVKNLMVNTNQVLHCPNWQGTVQLETITGKIFIPREYEMFGKTTNSAPGEHTNDSHSVQWPIFATAANRIKKLGKNGAVSIYWLSSAWVDTKMDYCTVETNGEVGTRIAHNSWGDLPCFRLKAAV